MLSISPGSGIVSMLGAGPNCASGGVLGHIGTCVWPGDGCQPGLWASKLAQPNKRDATNDKGFITTSLPHNTTPTPKAVTTSATSSNLEANDCARERSESMCFGEILSPPLNLGPVESSLDAIATFQFSHVRGVLVNFFRRDRLP